MNFDWQMTDINEAIRFAGGRERKQLITQRDRMGLSYNMEEDQIDAQRKRQKELWADEDERFKKQKDYTLQLNALDKQSFDTNRQQRQETFRMETENLSRKRSELEQQRVLEQEMTTLQRENQYKSIQLQKEAAGVQAWAAAKQQEYNLKLEEAAKGMGDAIGEIENANYDPATRYNNSLKSLVDKMATVSTVRTDKLTSMVGAVDTVNTSNIDKILQLLYTISFVNYGN